MSEEQNRKTFNTGGRKYLQDRLGIWTDRDEWLCSDFPGGAGVASASYLPRNKLWLLR